MFDLFMLSCEGVPFSTPDQLKGRLAELFVLNPLPEITNELTKIRDQIKTVQLPDGSFVLGIMEDEISHFSRIGTLIARSREKVFWNVMVGRHQELPEAKPQASPFTTYAINQVRYGDKQKRLIDRLNPETSDLLQCYKELFSIESNGFSRFSWECFDERLICATQVGDRYRKFMRNIDEVVRRQPAFVKCSSDYEYEKDLTDRIYGSVNMNRFFLPTPEGDIPLTTVVTAPSIRDALIQSQWFLHISQNNLLRALPFHQQLFETILNYKIDPQNPESFQEFIKLMADFVWCNSHLTQTLRGNAQYTLSLMTHLFRLHHVEVGPVKVDVTFIDCEALTLPREWFIERFAGYFDSPPKLTL